MSHVRPKTNDRLFSSFSIFLIPKKDPSFSWTKIRHHQKKSFKLSLEKFGCTFIQKKHFWSDRAEIGLVCSEIDDKSVSTAFFLTKDDETLPFFKKKKQQAQMNRFQRVGLLCAGFLLSVAVICGAITSIVYYAKLSKDVVAVGLVNVTSCDTNCSIALGCVQQVNATVSFRFNNKFYLTNTTFSSEDSCGGVQDCCASQVGSRLATAKINRKDPFNVTIPYEFQDLRNDLLVSSIVLGMFASVLATPVAFCFIPWMCVQHCREA